MNHESVIRMARQSGMSRSKHPEEWDIWKVDETQLERFAALIAAAEREAIVQMIESDDSMRWAGAAEVIRTRGNT